MKSAVEKTDWFEKARFGLFIHWGLYSVPGGEWQGRVMEPLGEWIQSYFRIPNAEYAELTHQFNPVDFNAEEWVVRAKRAGMRYVVFTTKHHDGFAMYGSKVDAYNMVDATPFRRDPLAELAHSCARHGLRLGLYYSQDLDWHDPDGGDPGSAFPKNLGTMSWGNDWDFPDVARKNFERYFKRKALPQLAELLSNYGPISLLWFDCPLSIEQENSHELMRLVHRLQPDCLVNSRVGNGYGDFGSMGDNEVPVSNVKGVWETAATLNDTWGFKQSDQNWKTGRDTLAILIALASSGANYLLNVGPRPDGSFPPPSIEALDFLAGWMDGNSGAIRGTRANPFGSPFPWGWVTARDSDENSNGRLYLIFRERPAGDFSLRGLRSRVVAIRPHDVPTPISFSQSQEDDVAVLRFALPSERSTNPYPVVVIEVEGPLAVDERILEQEGQIAFSAGQGRFIQLCSAPSVTVEGGVHVGAAGEITRTGNISSINQAGISINWLSQAEEMSWDFIAPGAGSYDVELVTSVPFWLKHHGGQRVLLTIDQQTIEAMVTADETVNTPETRYSRQAISRLGSVKIIQAGTHRITLRPVEFKAGDDVGLALVRVVLRRRA